MESTARASEEQFATLLKFMESHGDLARHQPGAQKRLKADRLWQELANALNAIGGGVIRTPDKWKKVWTEWKSETKTKALRIRRHASGTGGGPNTRLNLTALEARVLGIIGVLAVEGLAEIEEQGFNTPSIAPSHHVHLAVEDGMVAAPSQSPPLPAVVLPSSSTSRQSPPPPAALPLPTTPPPSSILQPSPQSFTTSPHRRRLAGRRRRTLTPFDRAASEFVAIEQARLQLDEKRKRNEARRIEVEAQRVKVENRTTDVLNRFADIAESFIQYLQSRPQ